MVNTKLLADQWIAEIMIDEGLVDPDRESHFSSELFGLIYDDPAVAWEVIKEISRRDLTDWATANFSSGPLTTFVDQHATAYREDIVKFYEENSSFRRQLLGIVFLEKLTVIFGDGFTIG